MVPGQKDALLRSGETAADDEDLLVREELPVARGAVGHAAAAELRLAGEAQHAGVRAGGDQHPEAGEDAPVRVDLLDVPVQLQVRDVRHQELRPEALRLGAHGIGQGPAVRPPRSGVVDDLGGDGDNNYYY